MITDPDTLLDSYNSNTLWDMARVARLSIATGKKPKKADLIRTMRREFFKPERIKKSYQQLPALERDVINRLLLHGGQISTRLLKRELIRAEIVTEAPSIERPKKESRWYDPSEETIYGRRADYIGSIDNSKSAVFEDVIARLTAKGLVFSGETHLNTGGVSFKLQLHPSELLFVPPFVKEHLPEPEPLPKQENAWQPVITLHGDPQHLLRDLYLYWDAVRANEIAMIQSGFVGKRGLKLINAVLLEPDATLDNARQEDQTGRLYLLRQLLEGLNLVDSWGGKLKITGKNTRAIPDFWRSTTAVQVAAVLKTLRRLETFFNFPDDGKYYLYNFDVQQALNLLLTALAELPTDWVEAEQLLFWLQDRSRNFLIPMRTQIESGRYYSGYYYGSREKSVPDMDELEQNFVHQATAKILFQLGLVELGFNRHEAKPEKWYAYRLTPLGSAVLKHQEQAAGEHSGQIIIQPNFQILAMGPVPLNLLAQLDLFAERVKVDKTAFEYHLSRESVYTAQQNGYTVENVQQFLESASPNELPQNIRRTLTEWAAHHDRIVFRRGVTLLQAEDEALLERLLADDKTGKLLAQPVGNGVALVKSKRKTELVEALHSAGLLPALSGANPEAADNSVVVDEDGRIQPIHAVPSLHLQGRLSRFAEETAAGWQLTEKTISRAGGSKNKVQTMLAELGKLNRGKLPEKLVDKLRAWGGYYGSATVGTVTLFEFRDKETLAELRQIPELENLLTPFPAGERALAVIEKDKLSAVRSILKKLGVEIGEMDSS